MAGQNAKHSNTSDYVRAVFLQNPVPYVRYVPGIMEGATVRRAALPQNDRFEVWSGEGKTSQKQCEQSPCQLARKIQQDAKVQKFSVTNLHGQRSQYDAIEIPGIDWKLLHTGGFVVTRSQVKPLRQQSGDAGAAQITATLEG
uniref:Uncharacterized protein n=1 Tax=Anopheles culicifacies TaxID=139723 RepID=A0A182M6H7_9DIPT